MSSSSLKRRPKKRILSLKGGGVKAISQVAILGMLEEHTGKPVCELFDVVGGASAGGLNAALYSLGRTSADILKLYLDPENTIFSARFRLWRSLFRTQRLKTIIERNIPDHNLKFKDTLCELVLISHNITEQIYYTFGTHTSPDLPLVDGIMRATSVFPFFEPYQGVWADGGMGSFNNPTEPIVRDLIARGHRPNQLSALFIESGFIPQRHILLDRNRRSTLSYSRWLVDNIATDSDKRSHSLFRYFFPDVEYHPLLFTYSGYYGMFQRSSILEMYNEARNFARDNMDTILAKIQA